MHQHVKTCKIHLQHSSNTKQSDSVKSVLYPPATLTIASLPNSTITPATKSTCYLTSSDMQNSPATLQIPTLQIPTSYCGTVRIWGRGRLGLVGVFYIFIIIILSIIFYQDASRRAYSTPEALRPSGTIRVRYERGVSGGRMSRGFGLTSGGLG